MKRLLLVTAFISVSAQMQASFASSELVLKIFDQSWFIVNLDNQSFGTPVTRFNLDHITPGSHFLRVTRINHDYHAIPQVVFNGYIDVPACSRIQAVIDRQNRFRINRIIPLAPEPVCVYPQPVAPAVFPMNDYDFSNLLHTIDRLSFESSRMQVARQAIASNLFTTRQVAELVRLMTFESSKLDLAKQAYHKTIDKQNYFMINDLFTFESSIIDLNNYIFRG